MVEGTKALEVPGATNYPKAVAGPSAEDSTPAALQAGSCATTAQAIASPTTLSTVCPPHQLDQSCYQCTPSILLGQSEDHPSRQC